MLFSSSRILFTLLFSSPTVRYCDGAFVPSPVNWANEDCFSLGFEVNSLSFPPCWMLPPPFLLSDISCRSLLKSVRLHDFNGGPPFLSCRSNLESFTAMKGSLHKNNPARFEWEYSARTAGRGTVPTAMVSCHVR